jgi:muramoyltetrapeptide carboxypeptidase
VTPVEMESAIQLLESWGLQVVVPEGFYASDNQFAGGDSHRAALMQNLLDNPEIKAVFCARGGYGTVRIIDRLDFSGFVHCPKWIVGYSDVTVLHSHIARNFGIPTLHAIMPVNIPSSCAEWNCPAVESLHHMLFEGRLHYDFKNRFSDVSNRTGECRGVLTGGNLSILYSLLGSASDIDTDNKILIIEDLDEYLYHIDRMIMALKRAGKLANLKGLLVGAMSDMHDNAVPFGRSAEQIVADAVAEYDYPVAFGCRFGHIGIDNCALPLGVETKVCVVQDSVAIDICL